MKTFFNLVNFVVGVLSLLVGMGNFLVVPLNPANVAAGIFALTISAACLWLTQQGATGGTQQLTWQFAGESPSVPHCAAPGCPRR
jgi:uncharacterized membrane protein YvlD (DUF360 family)